MAFREYNMLQRVFTCVLLAAACAPQVLAQGQPRIATEEQLTVRVTFEDDRRAPPDVRVELLSIYGSSVDIRATDDSGTVRFTHVTPAKYKVRISGAGIVTTESGEIDMTASGPNLTEYVRVRRDPSSRDEVGPLETIDVNVPPDARKEF